MEEVSLSMWNTIQDGAVSVIAISGEVFNMASTNEVCLAFLSATFVGIGVRILRRVIGAFGRGR